MATITEDYASFEVAKLLKEKGFDEPCVYVYRHNGSEDIWDADKEDIACQKPTLQMAMKWLREEHNIAIEPFVDFGNDNEYWWDVDITYIKKNGLIEELCGYDSYEEVCEMAILYCLENLI